MKENQKKTEVYGVTPEELSSKIASIVDSKIKNLQASDQIEKPIDINEAAKFLGLSVSNLHLKTSSRTIPFHKTGGNKSKLYFFKSELIEFIRGFVTPLPPAPALLADDACPAPPAPPPPGDASG